MFESCPDEEGIKTPVKYSGNKKPANAGLMVVRVHAHGVNSHPSPLKGT